MPGPQVANWAQYHALRRQGKTKASAARIVNAAASKPRRKGHLAKRKHAKRGRR